MSRKCLTWGSCSLLPFLNFSTSLWLDEGLVFSFQNICISSLTASTRFVFIRGNVPTKAQQYFSPMVSSCSLIEEYFLRVFVVILNMSDVCVSRRRCLVDLFTIDSDNTRRAAFRSFVRDVFPIKLNAD